MTPGYDYVLTGHSWPDPGHITYSIAPDGVPWGSGTNVLNATFNAEFGAVGAWQYQIAKALATWESVANINIAPVADGPYAFDTLGLTQGDPRFGDIRFGGFPFPSNLTTLAQTYFPPPDGSTGAGDIEVNTSMDFGINAGYDLYSVLLHETGHALGLNHPQNPAEVMYPVYQGIRTGLAPGDVAGIQAIYGVRPLDSYQQQGLGFSPQDPIDITSTLSSALRATISNAALASIGGSEYYGFISPSSTTDSVQVTVSSVGISMLSPEVSIYDSSGTLLAEAGDPSTWSDGVTAVATGIGPGQRYVVKISGATSDVFSVGAYAMTLSLLNGAGETGSPNSPAQQTTPPPGADNPVSVVILPDRFEPNNTPATATRLGTITQATVADVNLATGSDIDYFVFQTGSIGAFQVAAAGVILQVFTVRGRFIAGGEHQVSLPAARTHTTYLVKIQSPTRAPVANYSLSISHLASQSVRRKISRGLRQETAATSSRFDGHPKDSLSGSGAVSPRGGARFARPEVGVPPWPGWGLGKRMPQEFASYLKGSIGLW